MKTAIALASLLLLPLSIAADHHGFQDPLLDRLAGKWLMTGTIAGGPVHHDLDIEWVLGHYYLRIHEVARETKEDGTPAYEAIVFIGWDEETSRYVCLWLDETGGGGLKGETLGYAVRAGESLPFVFKTGEETAIHNTFTYDGEGDTWNWLIVNVRGEKQSNFADVTLARQ